MKKDKVLYYTSLIYVLLVIMLLISITSMEYSHPFIKYVCLAILFLTNTKKFLLSLILILDYKGKNLKITTEHKLKELYSYYNKVISDVYYRKNYLHCIKTLHPSEINYINILLSSTDFNELSSVYDSLKELYEQLCKTKSPEDKEIFLDDRDCIILLAHLFSTLKIDLKPHFVELLLKNIIRYKN